MPDSSDVLIIGGGVIGLSTALRLADEHVSVTVVDRGRAGKEASWAAAGMLPPGMIQHRTDAQIRGDVRSRETCLRSYSNALWPGLSKRLREQTGIDNGYRNCGALELASEEDADLHLRVAEWQSEGITVERLTTRAAVVRHVPDLHPGFSEAIWLPEFCQVRNPRHLKALEAACRLSGVEVLEDVPDVALNVNGSRVLVNCSDRRLNSDRICLTAGAWTDQLLRSVGVHLPIRPIRGQMVQLRVRQLPFRCVIEQGRRYLVPRPDGLILVGSTEEDTGFEKHTTSDGIRGLLKFALSIVPDLSQAELVRQWAGLRPGSPDGLPYLGRLQPFDNLYVGAGHFRSGLQMSPGSAAVLADALMNSTADVLVTL